MGDNEASNEDHGDGACFMLISNACSSVVTRYVANDKVTNTHLDPCLNIRTTAMSQSSATTKQSWCDLFPPPKIKGVLQAQEEVGQLREPVVRLVSAASALFIHDLVKSAKPTDGTLVTLAHLKAAVDGSEHQSSILDGIFESVVDVDDTNPYQMYKTAKTSKRNSSTSHPTIAKNKRIKPDGFLQEAMEVDEHAIQRERPAKAELIIDDDDYD
ncbi:hypothetical protein FisN_1Hu702 [Fistulifera solaris]|jgi:hypothetical protein|uniref:Transcription factor CBF/NF-Y/archaeal histone domain-containing protein n=1 Tax=Fistulifera solaris TaxID=1519565 RepID=A0A1Z5JMN6_FISSO|nr:hypothetical protein FisN_1Hu702 [Fistulifera solaris]|eukprot:GAX15265.1 hypothetical protein FisN_1Hu702 [Fistulifera solaris]